MHDPVKIPIPDLSLGKARKAFVVTYAGHTLAFAAGATVTADRPLRAFLDKHKLPVTWK